MEIKNSYYKRFDIFKKDIFYKLFFVKINNILNLYPFDFKLKDGNYFWSGTKRIPNVLEYDINDKISFQFTKSFIIILLQSLNINLTKFNIFNDQFEQILKNIFNENMNDLSKNNAINSNKIINGINKNEDIGKIEQQLTDEIKIQEIIFNQKLNLIKNKLWFKSDSIIPTIFEKDDDSNYHIEFINACSNLRARNYKIKECTHLDTKIISGKIIPAVASTTSIIVGYGCCQLLTLLSNKLLNIIENREDNSKKYQNYNINLFNEMRFNLADNFYVYNNPPKAKIFKPYKIINIEYINYKKYKAIKIRDIEDKDKIVKEEKKIKKYIHIIPKPEPFSIWDNIVINESFSFNELKQYFQKNYQVNLRGIYTLENKCLSSKKELFDTKIEIAYKDELQSNKREFILFNIDSDTDNNDIIKFPVIKYKFSK